MESRMDPVVLVARSALLACVAVVLGTASHLGTDGSTPSAGVLALLGALAFVAGLRLLRAPAGALRVVLVVLGGQVATHLVLTATAGHGGTAGTGGTGPTGPGALALPVTDGRRLGSLQDSHDVATGHVDLAHVSATQLVAGVPGHAPVLLVHLLVAAALGLGLALGERCLWTLLALLAGVVLRLPRLLVVVPARLPAVVRATRRAVPRVLLLLDRSVVRRGPPALAAAL